MTVRQVRDYTIENECDLKLSYPFQFLCCPDYLTLGIKSFWLRKSLDFSQWSAVIMGSVMCPNSLIARKS